MAKKRQILFTPFFRPRVNRTKRHPWMLPPEFQDIASNNFDALIATKMAFLVRRELSS
jgi:hypothetical protein